MFTPRHLVGIYLSRFERPATDEDVTYVRLAFSGELGAADPGAPLDAGIVRTLWLTLDEAARQPGAPPQRARPALPRGPGRGTGVPALGGHTDPTVFEPEVKR